VLGWWAAASGSYPLLVVSRVLGGVAGIMVVVALTNVVGSVFAGDREATAVGVFTAGGPAGIALGQVAGPRLDALLGWGATMLVFPVGAVAAFVLLAVVGNRRGATATTGSSPRLGDFRAVLTHRGLWHVGAMSFIAYSIFYFLSSWMPTYLTEAFGVSLAAGGLFLGVFTLGGVVARSGGGALSDRVFGSRRRPVALLSFVSTTLLVAVIALAGSIAVVLVALVVAGVTGQLTSGLFFTHAREVVADEVTGVAVALFVTVSVAGALTAPVFTGALIDYSGGYALAFGYAVVLGTVAVGLAWGAPEPNR
jgi:nitrate/nitrite transporter NarK